MNTLRLNFVFAVFLGIGLLLVSCQSNSTSQEKNIPSTSDTKAPSPDSNIASTESSINLVLPVAEFETLLKQKNNAQLLDVRTAEEVQSGSIPGATNYDFYQESFRQNLDLLDPQKPTFVYCKSGGRSGKTTSILQKMGFREVYDLQGGYTAWANSH